MGLHGGGNWFVQWGLGTIIIPLAKTIIISMLQVRFLSHILVLKILIHPDLVCKDENNTRPLAGARGTLVQSLNTAILIRVPRDLRKGTVGYRAILALLGMGH